MPFHSSELIPRFTVQRVLGVTAIMARGLTAFPLLPSYVDGYLVLFTLAGCAVGMLYRGLPGFFLGGILCWFLALVLMVLGFAIFMTYLMLTGQEMVPVQS